MKEHHYQSTIEWTGNNGSGTDHYNNYERSYQVKIDGKIMLEGSSDPAFRGDPSKHNPEDLLVASLSSCHMLSYLHFCAVNNIVVEKYVDNAFGIMVEETGGKAKFKEVILRPIVTVKDESMIEKALKLHKNANEYCFIANSVNFPVKHEVEIRVL